VPTAVLGCRVAGVKNMQNTWAMGALYSRGRREKVGIVEVGRVAAQMSAWEALRAKEDCQYSKPRYPVQDSRPRSEKVHAGNPAVKPKIGKKGKAVNTNRMQGTDVPAAEHVNELSTRRRQVLFQLLSGDSVKQIAKKQLHRE
jgi:DNA-binding NarL/FixJ family response regulator